MPVTCNMEWRSWNLLIACNTETVSLTLHDTILVLIEKPGMNHTAEKISTKSVNLCKMSANKRSLSQTLDCQSLIRRGAFSNHGTIPAILKPAQPRDLNKSHLHEIGKSL